MSVIVSLTLATICFVSNGAEECHPILYGDKTIPGEYTLIQRQTDTPGYGGDVLQFDEDEKTVYAIHRLWMGSPGQKRPQRLASSDLKQRKITNGCINVESLVYNRLVDCCSNQQLQIIK